MCPVCKQDSIRFYYREFGIVKQPKQRGTIWVWCRHCGIWDHISGFEPDTQFVYNNPLSEEEFKKIDTPFLIPQLNELWDKGVLPRKVTSQ